MNEDVSSSHDHNGITLTDFVEHLISLIPKHVFTKAARTTFQKGKIRKASKDGLKYSTEKNHQNDDTFNPDDEWMCLVPSINDDATNMALKNNGMFPFSFSLEDDFQTFICGDRSLLSGLTSLD